jgi:hypothetical protein
MTAGAGLQRGGNFQVPYRDTQAALRHLFANWDVKDWKVDRDGYTEEREQRHRGRTRVVDVWVPRSSTVTVSFYRNGQWQNLRCGRFDNYDANLRAIYLLLDRMRISEGYGVEYGGLTSSTDLVPASVTLTLTRRSQLLRELHLSDDAPFTVVEATWRRLVREASDRGDDAAVVRLNNAYNALKKEMQP